MQERHQWAPAGAQHRNERGRRDQPHVLARGAPPPPDVARRRPDQKFVAENEERCAVPEDERAVGKLIEPGVVVALHARGWFDTLAMELRVDRVGSDLAGVELAPDRDQAVVVLAATERAGAMPCGQCRRLVQKEQLGEAAGPQKRPALPAAELKPAGNPALAVVAPPDATGLVVEAARFP